MGNNPIMGVDPNGGFVINAIGAGIGFIVGGGISATTQYFENGKIDWGRAGLAGAIAGSGVGLVAGIASNIAFEAADQYLDKGKINVNKTLINVATGYAVAGSVGKLMTYSKHSNLYGYVKNLTLTGAKNLKNSISNVYGKNLIHGNRLNNLVGKGFDHFNNNINSGIGTYAAIKGIEASYDKMNDIINKGSDATKFWMFHYMNNFDFKKPGFSIIPEVWNATGKPIPEN